MLRFVLLFSIALRVQAALPPSIQDVFRIGGPAVIRASAVDQAGNLYLAGNTIGLPGLPNRTVFGPAKQQHPFLIKVDALRKSVVFTVEVGSSQVDEFSAPSKGRQGWSYARILDDAR